MVDPLVTRKNMGERNGRFVALGGVLATAVIATLLLMPAVHSLGQANGLWLGAAIMIVPTAAVLTATGYRYYGLVRSFGVAVMVMALTSVITWAVAVFTLVTAMSQSPTAMTVGVVLYLTPPVCVVIFAMLAMLVVSRPDEPGDPVPAHQHEHEGNRARR